MTTPSYDSMPAVIGRANFPPVGLGLSSVILGAIGLVLFLVPIIGISISVAGLVIGITGIVIAFLGGAASFRLSVAGVLLSSCALVIITAIALAPSGYFRPRSVFPSLPPSTDRPYVPPPAASRAAWHSAIFRSPLRT